MKTKPKILLIYKNQTLSQVFERALLEEGYPVELFFKKPLEKQLSWLQRMLNIYYRVVLKDTSYLEKAREINFRKACREALRAIKGNYDYGLAIRGDLIPEFVLKAVKKKCNKIVGFQLDGIAVSKRILDYRKYFDRIFVFDPEDVEKYPDYDLKFLPNCYFGPPEFNLPVTNDFLYIGQYLQDRNSKLAAMHTYLEKKSITYTSHTSLYRSRSYASLHPKVINHSNSTSYEENLEWVKKSKIIIDFKREEHNGLSLRFFEALQFGKKIITNNPHVLDYDFYHPYNIMVCDFENFKGLEEFLEVPVHSLNNRIIEKYNFKQWMRTLLSHQ